MPFDRLRRLMPGGGEPDLDAELRRWLGEWEPVVRDGGYNPGDVPAFLPEGEAVADTFEGHRWQIACAEVKRVLTEAEIEEDDFFDVNEILRSLKPGGTRPERRRGATPRPPPSRTASRARRSGCC